MGISNKQLRSSLSVAIDSCNRDFISYARIQRRPGSQREVRANHALSLSGSQAYKPQKETGRNSKPSQKAAFGQELERNIGSRPRPCLRHVWRITLARKLTVSQPLSCDLTHCLSEPNRIADLVSIPILARVESERLLIDITREVERFHGNIGSIQSTLQEAPKVLQAVRVNAPVNVLMKMVHDLVNVFLFCQPMIGHRLVGINGSSRLYFFQNLALQSFPFDVGQNLGSDCATIAIKQTHDRSLTDASTAFSINLLAASFVHVPHRTADEGFVGFNLVSGTADLPKVLFLESHANALQHEPCRLLGNVQRSAKFVRADAVLAIDQHPDSSHPLIQAKRGILEDGSDFNRELFLAAFAEPNQARLDERVFIAPAPWAGDYAIRPAQVNGIDKGAFRIGEINDGVLQALWFFHVANVRLFFVCVKYIIAFIFGAG
jgi:hypothetical protein